MRHWASMLQCNSSTCQLIIECKCKGNVMQLKSFKWSPIYVQSSLPICHVRISLLSLDISDSKSIRYRISVSYTFRIRNASAFALSSIICRMDISVLDEIWHYKHVQCDIKYKWRRILTLQALWELRIINDHDLFIHENKTRNNWSKILLLISTQPLRKIGTVKFGSK